MAQQDDPRTLAESAADALNLASAQLSAADRARDRVRALTSTVQAYEDGLAAMRSGMQQAAIREDQLRRQLQSRDTEIGQLLAVLQSVSPESAPTAFLHPDGPEGTARAGMLLAELIPRLGQRAARLRQDLEDVETLRLLQQDAAARLQQGLDEVQTARTALSQAMAERTDLPKRFAEDPVRTALLIASAETLAAFSSGLTEITGEEAAWAPPDLDARIGSLPAPVRGLLLRRAGEADAAGIVRPGILLATRPGALVTSPTEATIRYVGPLLDFGTVIILEPRPGTLFVFAGLGATYGSAGDIIAQGTPLGLMGATEATIQSTAGEGAGAGLTETLYMEVRQDNATQDPLGWFDIDKNG
ncbi:MAG: peptidoglycan DD-metalloendopeptidase family protein [Pseudomonadota bacterium]